MVCYCRRTEQVFIVQQMFMKHLLISGGRFTLAKIVLFMLLASLTAVQAKALSGSVAGRVFLDGKPAVGAKVSLYLLGKPHAAATTDAQGFYKMAGIWMGNYTIEASLGNLKSSPKALQVKRSETTNIDLQLISSPPPPPIALPNVAPDLKEKINVSYDVHTKAAPADAPIAPPLVAAEENEEIILEGSAEEESWDDEGYDEFGGGDSFSSEDLSDGDAFIMLPPLPVDREGYDHIDENRFLEVMQTPLSTFAIDVDAASYTNCRRMLLQEQRLPPAAAVRAEEFINYFDYSYPQPVGIHPFSITTELSACPWNAQHQLVHIGLQGKSIDMSALPPANLVFLLDVSGSMDEPNKLPLVKQALTMLVDQLRPQDQVAMVVYAGAAGMVLPSTSGNQKAKILAALQQLNAGGSTAGGEGIQLAYKIARENMQKGSNNRVILCTDGDFNVGTSSDGELVNLIEQERNSGVFLSVMGFGTGNYQDAKMEKLADNGNGNYNYIDQLLEAKRVMVTEIGGTLNTIAKDVKIQVEFNPAKVKSYRLIGYENRKLAAEDFDDDKKDAGELGAGHSVTALYEIEPTVGASATGSLRYQQQTLSPQADSKELLTVKFRYKAPDGDASLLIEQQCSAQPKALAEASENFRFSAAVAAFALLLHDSEHKGGATYQMALALGKGAKGKDLDGFRAEFLKMVETAALMSGEQAQR